MNARIAHTRRGLVLAATVTTASFLFTGCAGADATADDDAPYRILVLGAVNAEGALGINASTSVLSAEAGVEVANANGGILGRNIELEVADDQGDPTVAVTLIREAINSDAPPDAILNSGPSQIAEATLPIISQAGILSFNIGPTKTSADPSTFPLNFDIATGPGDHVVGFVDYFEEEGYESVGILHGSSSYGETFGDLAEAGLDSAGIKVLGNEEYDVASLDMTPQLEALQSKNPDVIALDAYGAPLGYILQGMEKLDWDIPIVGNISVASTSIVTSTPPSGVLGTEQVDNLSMQILQSAVYSPDTEPVTRAVEAMLGIGPIKASLTLAYNYDAVLLIQAAAESVGDADDPAAIAAALVNPEVTDGAATAVLENYVFTEEKHSPTIVGTDFRFIPPAAMVDGQFRVEK